MNNYEQEAAAIKAPHIGAISVLDVTTSSQRADLAAAAQLGSLVTQGHYVTLQADGADVYILFNNTDAGTADETATSGNNRVFTLKSGVPYNFILTKGFTWLCFKGSAATKLRGWVSSFNIADL